MKRPVSAKELVRFIDEIERVDPEERKRRAEETFKLHKQKFWTLIRTDESGEAKKFDQADWDKIMNKLEN